MLENVIGQRIHQAPCPMMMVRPTIDSAEEWSKIRFRGLVDASPALRNLVVEGRQSGNKASSVILQKMFPGGSLDIEGANSPSGLASKSICVLILDEEDRFPHSVVAEGSPSALAEMRTTAFHGRRKIIRTSTPTVLDESVIWDHFLKTDQCHYHVPCPCCGEYQRLYWRHPESGEYCVVWPKGEPWKAVYRCPVCAGEWKNREKAEILPVGRWVSSTVGRPNWRGAQLSTLYAPVGWDDFPKLAQEWEDSHPNGQIDREKLVVFINTRLGECWEDRMDTALDNNELLTRREPLVKYPAERVGRIPDHASMLLGTVDVQSNRLELHMAAWGLARENWSVRRETFWGDTGKDQVWEDMHQFVQLTPWLNVSGQRLAVVVVGIDTGYATDKVYEFIRSHQGWGYLPLKGEDGLDRLLIDPRPHTSGRKFGGLPFVMVGTDEAKRMTYAMLRIKDPGPQYCHFALDAGYEEEQFQQIIVERLVKRYDKTGHARFVWVKPPGKSNEMLDLFGYNLALASVYAQRYDLTSPILWAPPEGVAELQPKLTEKQTPVSTEREAPIRFDRSTFFRR